MPKKWCYEEDRCERCSSKLKIWTKIRITDSYGIPTLANSNGWYFTAGLPGYKCSVMYVLLVTKPSMADGA